MKIKIKPEKYLIPQRHEDGRLVLKEDADLKEASKQVLEIIAKAASYAMDQIAEREEELESVEDCIKNVVERQLEYMDFYMLVELIKSGQLEVVIHD